MKTARRANLEGALIGKLVTIVRGERYFTLPTRELRDLAELLRDLDDESLATTPEVARTRAAPASPAAVGVPTRTVATTSASRASAPQPTAARGTRGPRAAKTAAPGSTQRRGRVWEGIQALVRANGPQSYAQIIAMVEREGLTDRDIDHAVKIAIGKKRSAGELIDLPGGLFGLAGGDAKATTEDAAVPEKRRHRPGALWQSMRAYLARFPDGLTDKEIVDATAKHGWTTASDPSHAVKICLTRVRDQLERTSTGRYILAGSAPAAVAPPVEVPPAPTVRVRRKSAGAQESAAPVAATEPEPEEAQDAPRTGPGFDAAQHYPQRRRAR